jgi:hypothetical protein
LTEPVHRTSAYNRSFTNELGHRVTTDIERNDTLDAVRIFMGGPTSDASWRLTRREAEELRDALVAVLNLPPLIKNVSKTDG